MPPQPKITVPEWHKNSTSGIRIQKLTDENSFQDPRLISIVPNDVLPTVSRRDPRRKLARVWTSGNRIFDCKGPNVLQKILFAMTIGESAEEHVELQIGKKLKRNEKRMILRAKSQIKNLLKTEWNEQCIP